MRKVGVTDAPQTVGEARAELGEGPYWVPEDNCLLWVDIEGRMLHRTDAVTGVTASAELDEVSAAFPAFGGGILTAGGNRLTLRVPGGAPQSWTARAVAEAPAREDVRFNDGAVDSAGRVWIGSMHKGETQPVGALYRLDPGPVLTPVAEGAVVSNGLGWSPDGSRLYYSDSGLRRIDVFDYDPAVGGVSRRRVFADLSGVRGVPDGLTVDADGYVWAAMWGGGALRRFAPSGQQDAVLPVPVAQPTSCAFGGPDLGDLYVTTARVGLSEAALAAQPLAGRLLRLRPGPAGLPSASARALIPA